MCFSCMVPFQRGIPTGAAEMAVSGQNEWWCIDPSSSGRNGHEKESMPVVLRQYCIAIPHTACLEKSESSLAGQALELTLEAASHRVGAVGHDLGVRRLGG